MSLEKELVLQCAPTLAAIKTGNLFTVAYVDIYTLKLDISRWNSLFQNKGVKIFILKTTNVNALIYVYRESSLKNDMSKTAICEYLINCGYKSKNIDDILEDLKSRFRNNDNFPHEIGLFLSYPIEDVIGFICNQGENCYYCGYWKVYGDKEKCIKKFHEYDKCREVYLKHWANGESILQLTVAV